MQRCSSRLVCPVLLVCLVICTTALVHVEIINQRVHHVKDVIAELRQTYDSIKDTNDASSFRKSKTPDSVGEPGCHISKEGQGAMKGIPSTLCFVLNHQLHYNRLILCFLLSSVNSKSIYQHKMKHGKMRSVPDRPFISFSRCISFEDFVFVFGWFFYELWWLVTWHLDSPYLLPVNS